MKKLRIVLIALTAIVVLWGGMLITDTVRSQNFLEPVFAREKVCFSDVDSKEYQGLGYTVKREFFANENGETFCGCSEVYLFGKPFSAVIV